MELLGDTSKTTTRWRRRCPAHRSAQSRMLLALPRMTLQLFTGAPYPWHLAQGPFGNTVPHSRRETPSWLAHGCPRDNQSSPRRVAAAEQDAARQEGGERSFVYIALLFQTALRLR